MQPEDLKTKIDLDLRDEPENLDKIVDLCRTSLEYSVRSGEPRPHAKHLQIIDI